MNHENFEQARKYAERRLTQELSPALVYHGIGHTRADVVPAVETLAGMEGIQGESLYLLLTAAWFHDLGYVEQAVSHESISARIAMEVLPSFGCTEGEVEIIRRAILATALPQSPASLLDAVLVDADLDVLGRSDFMQRNADLRQELALFGTTFTDAEWYTRQLRFLEQHQYFTDAAHRLRDPQKHLNMESLKVILKALGAAHTFREDAA